MGVSMRCYSPDPGIVTSSYILAKVSKLMDTVSDLSILKLTLVYSKVSMLSPLYRLLDWVCAVWVIGGLREPFA